MTYIEKLRDPRWQKKRLEIMERDGWQCTMCGDNESNLQVHHKTYTYGMEPWEYHNNNLTTLCSACHTSEGIYKDNVNDLIHDMLQMGSSYKVIYDTLSEAFISMNYANTTLERLD